MVELWMVVEWLDDVVSSFDGWLMSYGDLSNCVVVGIGGIVIVFVMAGWNWCGLLWLIGLASCCVGCCCCWYCS